MSVFDSENPQEPKPSTPPQETPEQQAYMAFVKKHRDRCAQWARTHGNASFPIINVGGVCVWLTREQRRRIEAGRKRQFKKQAKIAFLELQLEIQKSLASVGLEPEKLG